MKLSHFPEVIIRVSQLSLLLSLIAKFSKEKMRVEASYGKRDVL